LIGMGMEKLVLKNLFGHFKVGSVVTQNKSFFKCNFKSKVILSHMLMLMNFLFT
jgi:hypothetical protein